MGQVGQTLNVAGGLWLGDAPWQLLYATVPSITQRPAPFCCRSIGGSLVFATRLFTTPRTGSMADETYGEERARNLEALLRNLAARIVEMDARGELLKQAGELMRLIGDVRSELFHYEVRATYDTPEVAENRRIVAEATDNPDNSWQKTEWTPDEDDEPTW